MPFRRTIAIEDGDDQRILRVVATDYTVCDLLLENESIIIIISFMIIITPILFRS